MLKNEFFENMKGHYNDYSIEELIASTSYEIANKYNLAYPTIVEITGNGEKFAQVFQNAGVEEFVFAVASTNAVDVIAEFLKIGYSITGVVAMAGYLGEDNSYITACESGLIFKR
jgi:hypothetical protein